MRTSGLGGTVLPVQISIQAADWKEHYETIKFSFETNRHHTGEQPSIHYNIGKNY